MALGDLLMDAGWKLFFVAIAVEISLIGVICAAWGIFSVRRTRLGAGAYQRQLRSLVSWRIVEMDPMGEYQQAEPAVVEWARRQGLGAVYCGLGVVAAGVLASCAVLLFPLDPRSAILWSSQHAMPQQLIPFVVAYFELVGVGMMAGLCLGYAHAFRRRDDDNPHLPQAASASGMGAYRAPWLMWLIVASVVLVCIVFALYAPPVFWRSHVAKIVTFLVLPGIAVAQVAALEIVARMFARMPLVHLPDSSESAGEIAGHQVESLRAYLVAIILCLQVAALVFLAGAQVLSLIGFVPLAALASSGSLGYVFVFEAFGLLILMGLLGSTHGRLGGSTTGWPWRPAINTAME